MLTGKSKITVNLFNEFLVALKYCMLVQDTHREAAKVKNLELKRSQKPFDFSDSICLCPVFQYYKKQCSQLKMNVSA